MYIQFSLLYLEIEPCKIDAASSICSPSVSCWDLSDGPFVLRSPWRCTSCSLIHFSGSLQWPLHVIALEGHARIHISGIDLVWKGKEETMMKPRGEGKKKKKRTGFFCSVAHLPHYNPTAGHLPLQHLALCFSYAASARGRSRPLWPCRAGCPLLNHCSQVSAGGTALPSGGDSIFRRLLCFLGGIDLLSVMLGKRQVAIVTSCSKVQGKSCSERLWKLHPWRCPKFQLYRALRSLI